MTVGERIKDMRKRKNITQVDLAKRVGISKQTLYKYEHNIVTNIPLDAIGKIAAALAVDPSHLMGWDEPLDAGNNEHDRMTAYAESLLHRLDDSDLKNITRTMEGWLRDDKYKKGVKKEVS